MDQGQLLKDSIVLLRKNERKRMMGEVNNKMNMYNRRKSRIAK